MKVAIVFSLPAMLALSGCDSHYQDRAKADAEAQAEIKALQAELEATKSQLSSERDRVEPAEKETEAKRTSKPKTEGQPMHGPHDELAAAAPAEQCWQDYCPCDTNDPDYGGADTTICRNLKGGVAVDSELFSSGAALRDARRAMREHKRDYGAF